MLCNVKYIMQWSVIESRVVCNGIQYDVIQSHAM